MVWARAMVRERAGDPAAAVHVLRSGPAVVVAAGDVVLKVHEPGTDAAGLAARLDATRRLSDRDLLLAPLDPEPVRVPLDGDDRWSSLWPRVEALQPDATRLPWAEAATLLARLHSEMPVRGLPLHTAPHRLRRDLAGMEVALAGLGEAGADAPSGVGEVHRAARVVRQAAAGLPAQVWLARSPGRPAAMVHGDFHLGQLGRVLGCGLEDDGRWVLIDVDDFGVGDPAWDLARPAAFWACGLLADQDWYRFLGSYRMACARGFGAFAQASVAGDPWPTLDLVARTCVVQTAAAAVRRAAQRAFTPGPALDDVDRRLVDTCARVADGARQGAHDRDRDRDPDRDRDRDQEEMNDQEEKNSRPMPPRW
jgi:hypothetical protein